MTKLIQIFLFISLIFSGCGIFRSKPRGGNIYDVPPVPPVLHDDETYKSHWEFLPKNYRQMLPQQFEFILEKNGEPKILGIGVYGHVFAIKEKSTGVDFVGKIFHKKFLEEMKISVERACTDEEEASVNVPVCGMITFMTLTFFCFLRAASTLGCPCVGC